MTMGPEPRTRMRSMSSRRGKPLQETVEEIQGVVRARAGLRVVLDRRARYVEQVQALDGAVVKVQQAQLGGAEVGLPADGLVGVDRLLAAGSEHREAVVLARDVDAAGLQVLHRVIGTTMAKGELEGLEADRPAEQLVAETDAPDRRLAHELADGVDHVIQSGRVARAVGEEDRV